MAPFNLKKDDGFFVDHLSHFSGVNVNPYSIQVAAQICKDFRLSVAGQRRLNKALNDLPCLDTADPSLSFGWSWEHIIRSPRVHEFGYEHLTLVITLAECFHETYAAEVLHHLAKQQLESSQPTPHIYQWLDLLHFCNGILANDEFGIVVENFIALDPYSVTPGGKYASNKCLTPPQSMATALVALSELACGERVSLTLRGGCVIGWVAALAEHFYDLTVSIESKQGDQLHGSKDAAQLTLIYTEKPEMVVEDSFMSALSNQVSNINLSPFPALVHFLPFGGRVNWHTLLPQVFGKAFQRLDHEHFKVMYTAIGSAFATMEAAKDNSSIGPKQGPHVMLSLPPDPPSAPTLIAMLTTSLTSLRRGEGRMEKQLKLTSQEAAKVHLDSILSLASVCNCNFCSTVSGKPLGTAVVADASADYCLPSVVETIIMIGLLLSRVVLDHPINPSREGVQLLYKLRTDRFSRTRDHNTLGPSPSMIASLYDNLLYAPTSQVLRMAVKFFAGGHLPPLGSELLPSEVVAIAHEGMCAFAAELAGGRGVRRDMKGMVRIVNGGFGIGQKSYRLAAWSQKQPGGKEGWQWEQVEVEHLKHESGGRLWFK